jgi:hypothetical protein
MQQILPLLLKALLLLNCLLVLQFFSTGIQSVVMMEWKERGV